MNNANYKNKAFLAEVTDGIDPRFIDEALGCIYVPECGQEQNIGSAISPRAKRKFYAKIAAAAACLVLVAGLMSAAPTILQKLGIYFPGSASSGTESEYNIQHEEPVLIKKPILTDEERQMIIEAGGGKIAEPFTCYVKFGDAYAVKQDEVLTENPRAKSSDYVMTIWEFRYTATYDDPDPIWIIKNGELSRINDAYLNDLVDKEFIRLAYFSYREDYNDIYPILYYNGTSPHEIAPTGLIELTEEEKDKIWEAYKEFYTGFYDNDPANLPPSEELFAEMRQNIECYGIWNGYYAVRFPYEIDDHHIVSDDFGYWFHYDDHQPIYFYNPLGEIEPLSNNNRISDFLYEVNIRHRYLNPELYEYFQAPEDFPYK